MNMILLQNSDCDASLNVAILKDQRAQHIRAVLKKGVGETVRIGILDGALGVGTIEEISDQETVLSCIWEPQVAERSGLNLLLALPRPKVMRRLWAQLASFAVDNIIICNAEKVERYYFDSHAITPETYLPLLHEGLQQAGHTQLPRVHVYRNFRPVIEDALELFPDRVMLTPRVPRRLDRLKPRPVLIAIGPEGGWNDFEHQLMIQHGFAETSLLDHVLRSDTACIAALTASSVFTD